MDLRYGALGGYRRCVQPQPEALGFLGEDPMEAADRPAVVAVLPSIGLAARNRFLVRKEHDKMQRTVGEQAHELTKQ